MIHQKENKGHRMSKIVKSRQSYSNDHLPYHCSFYHLAHALILMHDVRAVADLADAPSYFGQKKKKWLKEEKLAGQVK